VVLTSQYTLVAPISVPAGTMLLPGTVFPSGFDVRDIIGKKHRKCEKKKKHKKEKCHSSHRSEDKHHHC